MWFLFTRSSLSLLQKKLKRPWALFLDFDGTLVPIAPRPEEAVLDSSTRNLLRSISEWVPVAFVSGRAVWDLESRVGLTGVTYVGNHGLEITGGGVRYLMDGAVHWRQFLEKVSSQLQDDLGTIPGILLEDKVYTLSVHYRLANWNSRQKALELVSKRLTPFKDQGLIVIGQGKAVWEIRPPVEWNKGSAVVWILEQPGFKGRWPLYIGDDVTDQDAFRMIRNCGIGIVVGSAKKMGLAHYAISNPQGVHRFLQGLLDHLYGRKLLSENLLSS